MAVSGGCRTLAVLLLLLFTMVGEGRAQTGLMDLYLRAREYDPTFQQARLQREVAQQALRLNRSFLFPTITGDFEAAETAQDIQRSPSIVPRPVDSNGDGIPDRVTNPDDNPRFSSHRFTLTLSQPVFRADALRRIPQAQAGIRQKEAEFIAAEQALMVRTARALFDALLARDNLDFVTAERAAIERQLQASEQRLGSGLGTITDVHDARARFSDAQAREIEAENILNDALMGIAEITGQVPSSLVSLSESFPLLEPDTAEVDAWVRTAMFQNLALKSREHAVAIAKQEIKVQKAARLPSLNLDASWVDSDSDGTLTADAFSEIPTDTRTGRLSLRLGIPIYDGGAWSARAREAILRHQISLQELEVDRRRVDRETRRAYMGVVSGITRANALQQAVFSQERALESKAEGLQAGLDTGLEVLDARRDLYSARRDYSQARYVYILNSLQLKQATGSLGVQDLREINAHLE